MRGMGFVILFAAAAHAAALHYAMVVGQAQALAREPRRPAATLPARAAGRWRLAGVLGDGCVLRVRGQGPLVVTRLGHHPQGVHCAQLRITGAGPRPAVLWSAHGAFFAAHPSGEGTGTEAALSWPAAGERFTHVWVAGASWPLRVYALVDGPAGTAAARFVIHAASRISMAVRVTLFARAPGSIRGMGPLESLYWYGVANHVPAQALYPAVHDADGVLVKTATAAIWQPLADPHRLRRPLMTRHAAHAFGLLQRDRVSGRYESLAARYQDRASVWAALKVPQSAQIRLTEAPWCGPRNIVAYWRLPARIGPHGLAVAYTLTFGRQRAVARRARVIATLMGGDARSGDLKYVIEYAGAALAHVKLSALRAGIAVYPHTRVVEDRLERNPYTGGLRQVIQVVAASRPMRVRAWLGSARGAVSEIWQYWIFHPR